jgi:hypothetical protein
MPQQILPLIPRGATQINDLVSVFRDDTNWTYFYSTHPIYSHTEEDHRMFRLVTAQMVESGACRQKDIQRTFGVSKSSVIRSVNKLRSSGAEAFFTRRNGRRGGSVFTPDTLEKAQALLDQGRSRKDTAQELGLKYDTLRKAINDGRLTESAASTVALTKSCRDMIDTAAADGMGTGCTRVFERALASLGKMVGAPVCFKKCLDVPFGGVLCALPALLANGLLNGANQFLGQVKGYYTAIQILLLLAFMALCRIKSTEKLKRYSPGEFGNLFVVCHVF